MIYLTLLLVTFFSATPIAYGAQIDLKARVTEQVERIKLISGHSQFGYGELPEPFPPDDSAPVPQLIKYEMDVIPELVPYLADKSFTRADIWIESRWTSCSSHKRMCASCRRSRKHPRWIPAKSKS
jgi:hypothetical protein